MRFSSLVLAIAVLSSLTYAQADKRLAELSEITKRNEVLRESTANLVSRAVTLSERLKVIPKTDRDEAARISASVRRLQNGRCFSSLLDEYYGIGCAISLRAPDDGDQYDATALYYLDGKLHSSSEPSRGHLLIASVGDVPIEKIDEANPAFRALSKYPPPETPESAKTEFEADGFKFMRQAIVKPRTTYLFRVIGYAFDSRIDDIYAIRVLRRDSDESIVVIYKKLKSFAPPKLATDPIFTRDEIMQTGIRSVVAERLEELRLSPVTLEFPSRDEVVVKGSVRFDEAEQILAIVRKVSEPNRVKNQLEIR